MSGLVLSETVSIFGYGSLMTLSSTQVTMPNATNFRYASLSGYERRFSLISVSAIRNGSSDWETMEVAALAIRPAAESIVHGCVFEIPTEEFGAYKEREHRYKIITVCVSDGTTCYTVAEQTNDEYRISMSPAEYEERVGRYVKPLRPSANLWGYTDIKPLRAYLQKCVEAAAVMDAEMHRKDQPYPGGISGVCNFLDHCSLADGTRLRCYLQSHPERFSEEVNNIINTVVYSKQGSSLVKGVGLHESPHAASRLSSVKMLPVAGLFKQGTGFMTWNAALVTKEFLKTQRLHCQHIPRRTVCDISSGNGFLALAAAAMGAEVTATECFLAFNLLQANCKHNESNLGYIDTVEYAWGDAVSEKFSGISKAPGFEYDMIIMSDLLYISFRDDIEDIFLQAMLDLMPSGSTAELVFAFERRKLERECVFFQRLSEHFTFEEVDVVEQGLIDACKESDAGVVEEGELCMFYVPPPVRLLLLKRKPLD